MNLPFQEQQNYSSTTWQQQYFRPTQIEGYVQKLLKLHTQQKQPVFILGSVSWQKLGNVISKVTITTTMETTTYILMSLWLLVGNHWLMMDTQSWHNATTTATSNWFLCRNQISKLSDLSFDLLHHTDIWYQKPR